MTSEAKRNWIFITIFVAICLPGVYKLVSSKLDPKERPMYLPDPVRVTAAYVDPVNTVARIERVVPPLTLAWLHSLLANDDLTLTSVSQPYQQWPGLFTPQTVMLSPQRQFQLLRWRWDPQQITATLVLWNPGRSAENAELAVKLTADTWLGTGKVEREMWVELPVEVRHELQDLGYTRPPERVKLMELAWSDQPGAGGLELRVEAHASANRSQLLWQDQMRLEWQP